MTKEFLIRIVTVLAITFPAAVHEGALWHPLYSNRTTYTWWGPSHALHLGENWRASCQSFRDTSVNVTGLENISIYIRV